jgi:type IV pilus assembly protein PilC
MDPKGKEQTGTVTAANQSEAVSKVREKGLFPSSVTAESAGPKKKTAKKRSGGANMEIKLPAFMVRVKPKQLMVFTRQLATLIHAGLPLMRSLEVLKRQERNTALKKAVEEMEDSISGGQSFHESLAQHARIFDRLYINMVKAGEIGGVLDVVLNRLAEFMEKSHKLKQKIISSMTYPVVVLFVAMGIVYFLMTRIIPKFQEIFNDLLEGAKLPWLTQKVMAVSDKLSSGLLPTVLAIAGIVVLVKLLKKVKAGRVFIDKMRFHMPLFGRLSRIGAIARFSRTLGTLMASGVPVLQALLIVRETAGNAVLEKAITDIHDAVKEGENMAPPIEAAGIFPPIVISMVEVGEETGELPSMLIKVADAYDDEVDNTVTALSSIIEPLLIVGLALIVGTIVIALFLPLVQIIGKMGGA